MKFGSAEADTLGDILRWRRDVRHFLTDPINTEVIARLEQSMHLAPSVGNARPTRVIRVEDLALRAAIRADHIACNEVAAGTYDAEREAQYRGLKLAGLDAAPLQLAVFCETEPQAGHGLGRATMPETLMQSTVMAIHTLWLAARAENIGLGMVSILDPRAVEKIFGVPARWRFVAYLCLGHPEAEDDTPLLHRAGWQENAALPWEIR
jgi:5,6-dimethylbenzimidazole synthase